MPVITAGELQDEVAPSRPRASRTADSVASVPLFTKRTISTDGTMETTAGQLNFRAARRAVAGAARGSIVDCLNHCVGCVPQHERAPAHNEIDVLVSVDIPDAGLVRGRQKGMSANFLERALVSLRRPATAALRARKAARSCWSSRLLRCPFPNEVLLHCFHELDLRKRTGLHSFGVCDVHDAIYLERLPTGSPHGAARAPFGPGCCV
jgi:hypothetical protein